MMAEDFDIPDSAVVSIAFRYCRKYKLIPISVLIPIMFMAAIIDMCECGIKLAAIFFEENHWGE